MKSQNPLMLIQNKVGKTTDVLSINVEVDSFDSGQIMSLLKIGL